MTNITKREFDNGIASLTVFVNLKRDAIIEALDNIFSVSISDNIRERTEKYCNFVSLLYSTKEKNLAKYISRIVNDDENVYIHLVSQNREVPDTIRESVNRELVFLQAVADLTFDHLKTLVNPVTMIPEFDTDIVNLSEVYLNRTENISKYGYGIYSYYRAFYVGKDGDIIGVETPDPIRLTDLIDYEREKTVIIDNTKALLRGKPAANMLLTGDAGTGKSSTVKAVVNELAEEGLRLVEMRKDQLFLIPKVLGQLGSNPLKFVLFIDDLSFQKDDDNFGALKAALEGSVFAKTSNVVIYATSNRRHLVKESFSDRDGDDVHRNDTMQEIISLSDRFGIQLTFNRPDKNTYLNIVHSLANQFDINIETEELDLLAERFALGRGNRSARAARQFIDGMRSKV